MTPEGIRCVAPTVVTVGEQFALKVKITGQLRPIASHAQWDTPKPALHSPFNLNTQRQIQYHDNCLPEWTGTLRVHAESELNGPAALPFDGTNQGVFTGDTRPIATFPGFSFATPGIHFITLVDEASGVETMSNPVVVSETAPSERIFWGDPHWQTYFSDGIRCPEELYAFARDEGFLDFGAITDHVDALTDRQWEYFQAVTDDYNEPGRFVTLVGQEWTNHAPGHRNIYYRAAGGPILRCTDLRYDTLDKLWTALDELPHLDPIAIPHHPANVMMGVDWSLGWNPKYEKAVEIHSVWGSSEKPGDQGNHMAIQHCDGEKAGQHVIDALNLGYDFGFVGGGDIHDGRPGDAFHNESYPESPDHTWPTGYTAARVPILTRDAVLDAIGDHRTYATTQSRIYLDVQFRSASSEYVADIVAASEEGIREATIVVDGKDARVLHPDTDPCIIRCDDAAVSIEPGSYSYVRVVTNAGNMAWSSPYRP
jgi:hypothetical protein